MRMIAIGEVDEIVITHGIVRMADWLRAEIAQGAARGVRSPSYELLLEAIDGTPAVRGIQARIGKAPTLTPLWEPIATPAPIDIQYGDVAPAP